MCLEENPREIYVTVTGPVKVLIIPPSQISPEYCPHAGKGCNVFGVIGRNIFPKYVKNRRVINIKFH